MKIDIADHAVWVHRHATTKFYEILLVALQSKARSMGFEFVEGRVSELLSQAEADALGAAVLHAKIVDVAPFLAEEEMQKYVRTRTEEGEAGRWAGWLLDGLASRGIVLVRQESQATECQTV